MKLRILFFLLLTTPLKAQVVNLTTIEFDHVDWTLTDSYEIGYFSSLTATVPIQSGILAKPGTCNPCSGTLPSKPSAFQMWFVAVRAKQGLHLVHGVTPMSLLQSSWAPQQMLK
jgi:hypothetical protein